ncbi:MAG: anti-sigma factor [Chloroflexi bacterium]|nr:anti-sigma factor [Chloroflexota bacterium]MQC27900.1 hypothetical protein [Chloroflexota bacterium]
MTHDEVRDLLPAYALGALDQDEHAAVEEHLGGCREHDEELIELRATVLALGTLAEEREPSAALAGEIERLTGEVPGDRSAVAPVHMRPLAEPGARRSVAHRWWPRAAAAAAVLLVVFTAGWLAGGTLGAEERYSYVVQAPGGAVLEFSGIAGDDAVTVWMAGLDRLPPDQRYQIWAIRDDRWVTIGICNTNAEGRWRGDFAFTLATDEEIALTIEPTPGSDRPTSDPLIRTRF